MRKIIASVIIGTLLAGVASAQNAPFEVLDFLIGEWVGTGSGFGNEKSTIQSSFNYVMAGKYIEVTNDSKFAPTEAKPEGEHHLDKGFISFDENRKVMVFRQFHIEGYVNQYVLNDSLSSDSFFVFETEVIENFMPGGKARWTIKKVSGEQIETLFDVYFPNEGYACLGTNLLKRKE